MTSLAPFKFPKFRQVRTDLFILTVLAIVGGVASFLGAQLVSSVILEPGTDSTWFEADIPRVFANMTDRQSNHYRTKVHPLFSLIAFPPVYLLQKISDLDPTQSARVVIAIVAALWLGLLFALLRSIGCRRLDAILFSLLGATSAAAIFWFVVPETYSFGSLTISIALLFVACTQYTQWSSLWYIAVSAATLSITVTNWMVGLLVPVVNYRWKPSLQIAINAFFVVTVLWGVQKFLFPTAQFFLGDREEREYMMQAESGGILAVTRSFLAHTLVMPSLNSLESLSRPDWPVLSVQSSAPGSASLWGAIAVGLWFALLALGLWSLFTLKQHPKLRIVLGLSLLGQLVLHLVYGEETFLYSLHFVPLLILLAALSTLTRHRRWGLLLACGLVVCVGINNAQQFDRAKAFLLNHGTPRQLVRGQMENRPADPWLRGEGHVVLATPGSREENKAYHEPGGSFSPSVGSFGLSIWVTDARGNLEATSDTIPLNQLTQHFVRDDAGQIPSIETQTEFYRTTWSAAGSGQWKLDLQVPDGSTFKPSIVLRSVGPAGGAVRTLDWDDLQLNVNDRWIVRVSPTPNVVLGREGDRGWMEAASSESHWEGEEGWGYAKLQLGEGTQWQLTIEDSVEVSEIARLSIDRQPTPVLDLPNERFTESFQNQIEHLRMGIVGRQTRPGEPTNYPLPWLRDGAYEVVALLQTGQIELAKELAIDFAEQDFFGGFGPEADAPGLAIWALEEVAAQVNDPTFDRWLWPHIQRKAEFILKMLSTEETIYQGVTAPIVPKMEGNPELTLVAEPARDGLIVGKMDNHRPILFVNAVSYRGLMDAAALAERLDKTEDARRWRTAAVQLQQAWQNGFKPPESDNERTYISGLWPTWVAVGVRDEFAEQLQQRWQRLRDDRNEFRQTPLWTYFDVAEAHQWLFLDRFSSGDASPTERVWQTLEWFWNHQASPGLYTWWEGEGEENTSGRWERVRGWVSPPHVTPHYWTAAEMLLLQSDMLAYVDRSREDKPVLVVGAGIPPEWLDRSFKVQGLHVRGRQIDWQWNGQQVKVNIQGSQIATELGSAFPSGTPLSIEYAE
ncbi:MAG: hypothetical protein J7642_19690 [Cyanobacteria bacterium SBC]|nr:hypothetical protein [Cyanobacteria bacterium SBC]